MPKAKTANYTEQDIAVLKAGYTGADNATEVAALATATGAGQPGLRLAPHRS